MTSAEDEDGGVVPEARLKTTLKIFRRRVDKYVVGEGEGWRCLDLCANWNLSSQQM